MNCGVYQIKHVASGRVYVGSSINMKRRLAAHRQALRRGRHHSRKLQRAWDKYGPAAFTFSVLLCCAPEMRLFYEQLLLEGLRAEERGWNCSKLAHCPAVELTPESRAKLSATLRARAKKYEWDGKRLCIAELAEVTGVPAKLLDRRINECGWTVERAVTEAIGAKNATVPGFGKRQTFRQWAAELGVSESTLRGRINAGASIEDVACAQKRIAIGELAKLNGWPFSVVARRIQCGWGVADSLFLPPNAGKRGEFVKFQSVKNIREIAV